MSQISTQSFKSKLNSKEYTLIDLRTKEEQENYGVISENQLHIDVSQADARETILNLDTKSKYLLYCWHWVRSAQVREFMKGKGFHEVYDLRWGIDIWK